MPQPSRKTLRPITYAMVEFAAMKDMRRLMKQNRWAAELLFELVPHLQEGNGGVIVISRTTMCELLNCSMPTIERALRVLIEQGWVQRLKIGGAPALAINRRVAWVGPRDQIEHAVFSATVIASSSEQDAIALDPPPMRQVPTIADNEIPLLGGEDEPPPSQDELDGVPPLIATWPAETTNKPAFSISWKQRIRP